MKEKLNTEITNLTIGFCNSLKPRDKRFFVRDLNPGCILADQKDINLCELL